MAHDQQEWPRWLHRADGTGKVFDSPKHVPEAEEDEWFDYHEVFDESGELRPPEPPAEPPAE